MIVLYLISSIPFLISLYNLATFPRLKKGISKEKMLVSVIIPARNESENISECLNSIINQTYENIEVIVVDDNSEDDTYTQAKKFKNVTVLKGKELKKGWKGKNWACYQGYQESKGEYILFIDADVRLGKDVISDSIFHIQKYSLSLLSVFPHLTSKSIFGQININNLKWLLLSYLPLNLVRLNNRPGFNAAIGQFLLFTKDGYESIEGHKGIKNEAVEDMAISYRLKSSGKSIDAVLGSPEDVTCMMYPDLKTSINGLGRSMSGSVKGFKTANLALILFSVLPFISSIILITDNSYIGITFLVFNYLNTLVLSYQSPLYLFIFPLQYIFYLTTIIFTTINYFKGPTLWRGREV